MSGEDITLLGNGKLTVSSRIASVWGAGLATILTTVLSFVGHSMWNDYKTFQTNTTIELAATHQGLEDIKVLLGGGLERGKGRDAKEQQALDENKNQGVMLLDHEVRIVRLETKNNITTKARQ